MEVYAEIDSWTCYKAVRARKQDTATTNELRIDGHILRDSDKIRDAWGDHFSQLSRPLSQPHFDERHRHQISARVKDMFDQSFHNSDGICENMIHLEELKTDTLSKL